MYHVIALLIAAGSLVFGYRRGFLRRVPSAIGMAFGILGARIFMHPVADVMRDNFSGLAGKVQQEFVCESLAVFAVFMVLYALFSVITGFLGSVLDKGEHTILNNIGGAVYQLFAALLFLSIGYNLIVCIDIKSSLLTAMKSDDGNIVEEVMMIAPTVLGNEGGDELAHQVQLEEAKKIS